MPELDKLRENVFVGTSTAAGPVGKRFQNLTGKECFKNLINFTGGMMRMHML
ncbi:hypothetical protein P3S67_006577 [Capsicum chacoense]